MQINNPKRANLLLLEKVRTLLKAQQSSTQLQARLASPYDEDLQHTVNKLAQVLKYVEGEGAAQFVKMKGQIQEEVNAQQAKTTAEVEKLKQIETEAYTAIQKMLDASWPDSHNPFLSDNGKRIHKDLDMHFNVNFDAGPSLGLDSNVQRQGIILQIDNKIGVDRDTHNGTLAP